MSEGAHLGPNAVVATAGHVDHGKSTLIRRLTGIDPDRLEEEKRRGLTIELGYAWMTLPSGREIGFVDVPGHERFVRTMLAGVGPVRLVLFVVAADEGWRRQTEEHLEIVDVLGVDGALIALTKRDAVDDARLATVTDEVRVRTARTSLETAPIITVSARTGDGIDELAAALDAMVGSVPPPPDDVRPRLFVDRVFSIAGAGTVVTGTLTGGRLATGDAVEVVPGGDRARIRGLQSHERTIGTATPVSRVAVNLAGIGRERVHRGDVIGHPGTWRPTDRLEARITPVRGLEHALGARGAFTFHTGSAERDARVRVYGSERVADDGAFVRIRLSSPTALEIGDRFVLRESGRRETVAGGVVLDADPPSRPGNDPEARLAARLGASRAELASLLVLERRAVRADELRAVAGAATPGDASELGGWWIDPELIASTGRATLEILASGPTDVANARDAIARSLRRARIVEDATLVDALLDELVRRGEIVRDGATIALPGTTGPGAGAVARAVEVVAAGEPTPPSISELRANGVELAVIDAAVRAGALVRIAPDLVVTPAFVERALEVVRAATGGATVSTVREALGTSRKYAVPLMEHLDRAGETRREGDLRFARARA